MFGRNTMAWTVGVILMLMAGYLMLAWLNSGSTELLQIDEPLHHARVEVETPTLRRLRLEGRIYDLISATERCNSCHDTTNGYVVHQDHFLNRRATLTRQDWAKTISLEAKCGSCHLLPEPDQLPTERWGDAVANFMSKVTYYLEQAPTFQPVPAHQPYREWMRQTHNQWMDVLHYYLVFSRPGTAALPPDPSIAGIRFEAVFLGIAPSPQEIDQIGNVNVVDLDRDGQPDVLVCDFKRHMVSWIQIQGARWEEYMLASVPFPGHAEAGDFNGDGHVDIVVADVGSDAPTDERVGGVFLLTNDGQMQFERSTLLENVGRVADVRPGDFDSDGDIDFVVAVFGFLKEGEIGWLEQRSDGTFAYQRLSDKTGGVHVPTVDLNGDGRLDFIALISQEHEEVLAFINQGDGRFIEHILFKAGSPTFGSSSIELVDLDQDGDVDVLYTNGDAFDLSAPMIRPYHGVQWLENRGDLRFEFHDLIRFYGAYRAVPGDLDGDGDLDVVAVSLINDWPDPQRVSILWLENDGQQRFTSHGIGRAPTSLITADVADLNGDGRVDIVTGSMHMDPSDKRRGRVTLWKNLGLHE